jgi:hypothetical protein
MEYRLLVDLQVIEMLDDLPKRVRQRLLLQFHKIRSFPTNHSDYQEQDAVGRTIEICILAGWAIHYWIDFADRHVKVLALRPADQ